MSGESNSCLNRREAVSDFRNEVCSGMSIVMSKWIGLQGTACLVREHGREVSARLPAAMVHRMAAFGDNISVAAETEIASGFDVCDLREITDGGIWRALWELAQEHGVGLTVDLQKISVKQETIEVCEIFGLNPYELMSGGALLMVTWQGEALSAALSEAGIHAAVIGFITDSHDKIVVRHTEEGLKVRYLNRPRREPGGDRV